MNQPQNPGDLDYTNDQLANDGLDDDLYMDDHDPLAEMDQEHVEQQDTAPAKKSKMLSMLIIGVGAVIGLGMVYTMLSGGSQQPAQMNEQPADMSATTPVPTDAAGVPMPTDPNAAMQPDGSLPMPPATDMTNTMPAAPGTPDALATLPPTPQPAPADPNQILATELPALAGTEQATPADAAPALTDTPPAPVTPQPSIAVGEPNPATPPVVKTEPTPKAEPAPATPTTPQPTANNADLAALTTSLEKIDERLQAMEGRLDTQSETQAKLAEDINALKSTIKKAEAKTTTSSSEEARSVIEEVNEPAPTPKKTTPPKKKRVLTPEDKAYVPPPIEKKPTAAAPVTNAVSEWQLRGAAQGKAWVAKAGSTELLVVTVGDTLPGLGVISSITNNGGKWVVQGQTGRITD